MQQHKPKRIPPREWLAWPLVSDRTDKHHKVRADDAGQLWELEKSGYSAVTIKPFEPVELLDLYRVHQFRTAAPAAGVS